MQLKSRKQYALRAMYSPVAKQNCRLWWTMWSTGLCKVCFLRIADIGALSSIGKFWLVVDLRYLTCLRLEAAQS